MAWAQRSWGATCSDLFAGRGATRTGKGGGVTHEAAGGAPISIARGAACARQAIAAGLVDEIDLQINAVILGSGERLLDAFAAGRPALELDRVLEAPGVLHVRYRVIR
jgi:hypothetical protein